MYRCTLCRLDFNSLTGVCPRCEAKYTPGDTPVDLDNVGAQVDSSYVKPVPVDALLAEGRYTFPDMRLVPPELKDSNPKEAVGDTKLPLYLVPSSFISYLALAFLEGMLKYGAFNYRVVGVRSSTYISAIKRHLGQIEAGEWEDPETGVPHLASIGACCGIMLDTKDIGKLVDDRPPAADAGLTRRLVAKVAHLKELFKSHKPKHYTISDVPQPEGDKR